MNTHQDTQLNRGRCSYSPKQHIVYVVDEEEVNPNPTEEQTEQQLEQPNSKPEITSQKNITFNPAH